MFCSDALKFIMNSRKYFEKSNFKIFKVMKSTSNSIFSHYLLSITFDDKFLKTHIDILYSSI